MLGNTMLQNSTVHCPHNFFLWEDREKREEKDRRQRGRKDPLGHPNREEFPPLLMENQTLLLEYKILTCLSPAPPFASFTSIFFFFRCVLLSGPERQKRMSALPFSKSWKHHEFFKRSHGTANFIFFRKTDYLQECVLTAYKQACLSGMGTHLSWTHIFAKSSACSSHCCPKGTLPWASRNHLNSKTSASASPPKIPLYHCHQTLLSANLNKYVLPARDAVKAVPALDSTPLVRPGYLRRSAAVGCKHPWFAA